MGIDKYRRSVLKKIDYLNERTARTEILSENVEKYRQQGFPIIVLVRSQEDLFRPLEKSASAWYEIGESSVEEVKKQFQGKALSFFKLHGEIITEQPTVGTTMKDWWEAIKHPNIFR